MDRYRSLFEELNKVRQATNYEPKAKPPTEVTLRPYQTEAVEAVFEAWNAGQHSVLVQLPTGCGKSLVFTEVMRRICSPDE